MALLSGGIEENYPSISHKKEEEGNFKVANGGGARRGLSNKKKSVIAVIAGVARWTKENCGEKLIIAVV